MNRQLIIILAVLVLLVGSIGFFFYRVYADLQTVKTQVGLLSNVSTSTSPLMQATGAGVRENFAALCLISQNPQVCQAAGINPQQSANPTQ